MNGFDLASIGGIAAATIVLVQVIKAQLGNVPLAAKLPAWVYAVLVSGLLVITANRVLGTLQGDFWQLFVQGVMTAASASGFYEWIRSAAKPIENTSLAQSAWFDTKAAKDKYKLNAFFLPFLLSLAVICGGCVSRAHYQADALRMKALGPATRAWVEQHPEQAQTWSDFWRVWEREVEGAATERRSDEATK